MLVIRLVHQNREFIQVTGSNGVHHVFLDLMDVRIDVKDEGNSIDTTVLDPGIATIWCSCETYLTRLLMSVEGQMVGPINPFSTIDIKQAH
ncbi:hypothetical protein AG1IA_03490 [Rhizoctonia solani AG-1 IA]|uniref:Uncharacterized protein n=1 Tax=Thanatephorus cucumeris (strain AG1-IA) TaxID=983506 RepID=L8WWU4_THACA|nr:hypothetical protein AG1IA_03490 [Rhizoctonia solani AG-1 IA]